jgi:hypothetical protein
MERFGEKFIHQRDPSLHDSELVEHEVERRKRRGDKVSQKPVEKISDWMKVLERTHTSHRDNSNVTERIKSYYHREHVIKPEDIPESYFENQRRVAREQGHGDIEITNDMKQELAEVIISDQRSTLNKWIEYLTSSDTDIYPTWVKYWAFKGMLKLSSFDKEKKAFTNRGKGTVAPFADLNRESLAYVIDALVKKVEKKNISDIENPEFNNLLQGANFGKLYAWAIEKATPDQESEMTNISGEWITYKKGTDHMPLVNSLQGHATGWCTAGETTAESQLKAGDFHVYYSYDKNNQPTIPRVAMRMEEHNIVEIRGVAKEQNLDPFISESDILDKKLKEFGKEGELYEKKSSDMKRLTEIEKKTKKGEELSSEDLIFLYEIDSKIQGFGYQKDPRIEEITENKDIKEDISKITVFSKDEISINVREALRGDIKYHYGDLELDSLTSAKEALKGGLKYHNYGSIDPSAERLKLPESVGGDLNLSRLTSAEGLKLPESVGRDLNLSSLTSAEGLKLPESVGGSLDLYSLTSAEGLKLPESVGRDLNLSSLTSAEGLKLPESVGGSIYLEKNLFEEQERINIYNKYPGIRIIFE